MPKGTSLLLIVWNVILTALLGWSLTRKPALATAAGAEDKGSEPSLTISPTPLVRDTAALKNARIAYYELDSVESGYKLIEESKGRVKGEGERRKKELKNAEDRLAARYQELAPKEPYMTMAEKESAQKELAGMQQDLEQMRADAEESLGNLQVNVTQQINDEIVAALEEYNKTAGFDYIISVAEAGQVWPGNKGLNVTKDIVALLNARHQAGKKK